MRAFLLALLLSVCGSLAPLSPAWAVLPAEVLPDAKLEERAREISKDLRCLVCQNQSIDDSNADLARDLRVIVRDRLKKGDSDEQVMQYVTDRYGDYVLLRPPFKAITMLLWGGPFAVLAISALGMAFYLRTRRRAAGGGTGDTAPLTDYERQRLDAILRKDGT